MSIGWAIVSTGRHPDLKMTPAINAARDTRVSAVVSRDIGRAQAFAAKHNVANAYDDFDAMLRNSNVQVVYLASPNALHAEQAIKAALAGKHVLCEKPMTTTLRDAHQMVEAAARHNVKLGVGFHLRSHPAHQQLREIVARGSLGVIALAQAQWGGGPRGQVVPPPRPPLQQWWEDPELAGAGGFMGTGVHAVDLLRFVLNDEVVEVSALTDGQREEQPLEHLATLLLRFKSGALATAVSSRRLPDSLNDIVIYGSNGRGGVHGSLTVDLTGKLDIASTSLTTTHTYEPPDPLALYTMQVEAMNRAVQGRGEPLATGYDGLKVVEITLAMVESARTGKLVRIPS